MSGATTALASAESRFGEDGAGDVPRSRTSRAVCHGVLAIAQRAHRLAGELRDVGSSVTVGKRTAYLQVPTKDSRSLIGVCSKPQSENAEHRLPAEMRSAT